MAADYKIAFYGFGSFPVVYRHLVELARRERQPLEWCTILSQPNYRAVTREVLPKSEILDVFRTLPRTPIGGDLACLADYPGSLAEDLAAQKVLLRKFSGKWLHDRGVDYYRLYKTFLQERGATHLLMSNVETPDAKIAVAVARELGLGIIAPVDIRNLSGTYFAKDACETPPDYAAVTSETRARAEAFVSQFRERATVARHMPADIEPTADEQELLHDYMPGLAKRMRGFAEGIMERSDLFDYDLLRVSIMVNAPLLRKAVRGPRKWLNARQYDISTADELPRRFIYYPLHYSPESSINVPAPFFVDQVRALDALRYAMPSDMALVVKEHPVCLDMRPVRFLREIRRLPGVIVVPSSMPSQTLIERAALTATVTGTAALEAFLLGRPAIALGPALPGWAIGRQASLEGLRNEIMRAMAQPPSDDFVIDQVARLMSARYPFYFSTAHTPGEPMLRRGNMRRFLAALMDHLRREHEHRAAAGGRNASPIPRHQVRAGL